MNLPAEEIYSIIIQQIQSLSSIAKSYGKKLQHVKPHGALYNMAAKDISIAGAIVKAVKDYDDSLLLFGLPKSEIEKSAAANNIKFIGEVFADRTYQPDGSLTPRTLPNALIEKEAKAIEQVMQIINNNTVTCINGEIILLIGDTICIHGDGKHAVQFAEALHGTLLSKGITIQSFNT